MNLAGLRCRAAGFLRVGRHSSAALPKSGLWSVLPLAVLLLIAWPLHAFVVNSNSTGQTRRWPLLPSDPRISTNVVNPSTKAIRYFLGAAAYSTTNSAAELNALRVSFDQWQSIPGTGLRFEDAGIISSEVDVNTSDNTNVVFWARKSTLVNGGLDDISGTLGVTFPRVTADNLIQEADIVLNGVQFNWFTDFRSNQPDQFIESSALHEIGHFIGLDHSPVGGATMLARGAAGVNAQAGLSSDEIAAARTLYPIGEQLRRLGTIQGRVALDGAGVFGACVFVEDSAGNVVSGTVTGLDGRYELSALAPGNYQVRAAPLDSVLANPLARLVSGPDIAPRFANAETGFLPTANRAVAVAAAVIAGADFAVTKGDPAFRIARVRPAAREGAELVALNSPAMIRVGESNLVVGVYSPNFPSVGAALTVTGGGLMLGPASFVSNAFPNARPSLNLISIAIRADRNATPGLRTFIVQQGTNIAYANGFLEIRPAFPDDNFDVLDDSFQRRYFPRFTAAEAAPTADPDGDKFNNASESVAGTDPTNRLSLLRIERVTVTPDGTTIAWQSLAGKRYQLFRNSELGKNAWEPVGAAVLSSGDSVQLLDSSAPIRARFYRVQVAP